MTVVAGLSASPSASRAGSSRVQLGVVPAARWLPGWIIGRRVMLRSLALACFSIASGGITAAEDAEWDVDVPGRFWYVSTSGVDGAPGTKLAPLRRIQSAAELAMPGDAVLVDAGIYRERVVPVRGGNDGLPIIYKARPGAVVRISGSDPWNPTWTAGASRRWSAVLDDAIFTDNRYYDGPNPFLIVLASTPYGENGLPENTAVPGSGDPGLSYTLGQVFADDRPLRQRGRLVDLDGNPGSWWVDRATKTIHFHAADDRHPSAMAIEISARRRVFAPYLRKLGHIHVIGFVIERAGNQHPRDFWMVTANGQAGAISTRSGHRWLIRGNVIREAGTIGLDCGREGGLDPEISNDGINAAIDTGHHVIEDNVFLDNGSNGIAAYISTGTIIRRNLFQRNNAQRFRGFKRFEQSAIKAHQANGLLVADNCFVDDYTHAVYVDNGWPDTRITRNLVINAEDSAIFVEFSGYTEPDRLLVDHNVIFNALGSGIYCSDAAGVTAAHNLIVGSRNGHGFLLGTAITMRLDNLRSNQARAQHNAFVNNVVINPVVPADLAHPSVLASQRRIGGNRWTPGPATTSFLINPYSTVPALNMNTMLSAVAGDLSVSSESIDGRPHLLRAVLNGAQWQTFWTLRGAVAGEAASERQSLDTVTFSEATLGVALTMSNDSPGLPLPALGLDRDFAGELLPEAGGLRPGPWQTLPVGTQVLWQGPRPVAAGALPILRRVRLNVGMPDVISNARLEDGRSVGSDGLHRSAGDGVIDTLPPYAPARSLAITLVVSDDG